MRAEAITDKYTWLAVSSLLCLWIKHTCEPLQANVRVGVPSLRAGVLPPRSRECGPVAPVSRGWPDDHRVQIPTVAANAFDRSDYCAFDTRTSIDLHVILTY
jgi:hypothetical protein